MPVENFARNFLVEETVAARVEAAFVLDAVVALESAAPAAEAAAGFEMTAAASEVLVWGQLDLAALGSTTAAAAAVVEVVVVVEVPAEDCRLAAASVVCEFAMP